MPRFQEENLARNLALYDRFNALAEQVGCTPAQLSMAWLLTRGEQVIPIPGTTSLKHLAENIAASSVTVPAAIVAEIDALLGPGAVAGARYPAATQAEIDTEEY